MLQQLQPDKKFIFLPANLSKNSVKSDIPIGIEPAWYGLDKIGVFLNCPVHLPRCTEYLQKNAKKFIFQNIKLL
jgi:hypothetical protein